MMSRDYIYVNVYCCDRTGQIGESGALGREGWERASWLFWCSKVVAPACVRSARLRPISMKVFLIMRLRDASLSIRVLATLCRPIESLTTKGKFRLDNFVSRWSSCPNEMSMLDHFNLLFGSLRWARLISLSSFFPYVFKTMDTLPPNISLISSIWSSLSGSAHQCSHHGSCAAGFSRIFLRSRIFLHYSRSCPEMRCVTPYISNQQGYGNHIFKKS
jgi:hypothetical protein